MTGPRDPRISVYPSLTEPDMWTWTVTSSTFGVKGEKPTEAAAWRAAENVLLVCDPPTVAKAAA
jgi:hypothetical protein